MGYVGVVMKLFIEYVKVIIMLFLLSCICLYSLFNAWDNFFVDAWRYYEEQALNNRFIYLAFARGLFWLSVAFFMAWVPVYWRALYFAQVQADIVKQAKAKDNVLRTMRHY